MNARNRAPWAVLVITVFVTAVAAGVTRALLEARDELSELRAEVPDDDLQADADLTRMDWTQTDEYIRRLAP